MWQAGYACNDVHASRGRCTVDASVIARLKDASEKRFQMFVFSAQTKTEQPFDSYPSKLPILLSRAAASRHTSIEAMRVNATLGEVSLAES